MHEFQYHLEKNLYKLFQDLKSGHYRHGGYRRFVVCDNKRREISVASIRDRVVHRLVYDYLVKNYDKTFIYDAWSCRVGKGLLGAIERTQDFLSGAMPWVWKCDVRKFFDSVDQSILLKILSRRTKDSATFNLLTETISSFSFVPGGRVGIPIGNLTSQIFANIYLNELDRYMKHELGVKGDLRYGDDFIVVENDLVRLEHIQAETIRFLNEKLKLQVNQGRNKIMKTSQGLQILGVKIWPSGRVFNKRNQARIYRRLTHENVSSYYGLINKHGNSKQRKIFDWTVCAEILPTQ